jgi:hypothetical protein
MTATIGLERLPRAAGELLDESAANLLATANELDALVTHGPATALALIEIREGRCALA